MKNLKSGFLLLAFSLIILVATNVAQETKPDKPAEPKGGMQAIVKNVIYPEVAKNAGIQGKVFVVATVDEKGNVLKTKIMKGIHELLDESAQKAVKATKFIPAEKDGKKIKSQITVPIVFKLS
jgi:protein TonB